MSLLPREMLRKGNGFHIHRQCLPCYKFCNLTQSYGYAVSSYQYKWRQRERTCVARQRSRVWLSTVSHSDLQPSFFKIFTGYTSHWGGGRRGEGSRGATSGIWYRLAIAQRLFSSELLCPCFLVSFYLRLDCCFCTSIFNFIWGVSENCPGNNLCNG